MGTPRRFRIPAYCLHRASGQAVVRIHGRDYYLGEHGSPRSREEYERVIRRHLQVPDRSGSGPVLDDLTVTELILRYWRHAEVYYRTADGKPSGEMEPLKHAFKFLRDVAGGWLARDFSPLRLSDVRDSMIAGKLCRTVVNAHVSRVRRLFKWAVAQELVPPSVFHGLLAVSGLRRGRSSARETDPVEPVAEKDVLATLPHLAPPPRAMVEIQRLSGMRPGEVCRLRSGEIEMPEKGAWIYRPAQHKGAHRGQLKEIWLGPRAQEILRAFLLLDRDAPLFSPRASAAWWAAQRVRPNGPRRPRKAEPRRAPGPAYTTASYRRAIAYACKKAGVEVWTPNQLRHTRATELRRTEGLEAAAAVLGHSRLETTQIYAEKNRALAKRIAEERG